MFDTLPPGRLREDRARPPGVRADRARAASPGAAGTATEAPASVFLGRARALRPRSSPASSRLAASPHRPNKTSFNTQAHATRRSARSGAARPPAFAPRVRSRGESLASTAATRADRPCVAQKRARRTFGARLRVGNREVVWRLSPENVRVRRKISLLQCVRSLEKGLSSCAKFFPTFFPR